MSPEILEILKYVGIAIGAVFTAIGGKEFFRFVVNHFIKMKEQKIVAMQESRSRQQSHEIETSGTLIEQFLDQNKEMSAWFMQFAGSELKNASSSIAGLNTLIREVYTQQDVVLREVQGVVTEQIEMKHTLKSDIQDVLEDEIPVILQHALDDILPKIIADIIVQIQEHRYVLENSVKTDTNTMEVHPDGVKQGIGTE